MLNRESVEAEEEELRELVRELPDKKRKEFFAQANLKVKDPDTYAVLNWFFLAGLHHFYLERWFRGAVNLMTFLLGVALLAALPVVGLLLVAGIVLVELWALFRSRIIVQDWNNQLYRRLLDRYAESERSGGAELASSESSG